MTSWIEDPGVDSWNGLKFSDLGVDEAYLNVTNLADVPLWLYSLSDDCVRCPFVKQTIIRPEKNILKLSTKHGLKFRITSDGGAEDIAVNNITARVCSDFNADMGEFGVYNLLLEPLPDDYMRCRFKTEKEPVNIYLPLAAIFLGLLVLATLGIIYSVVTKKIKSYYENKRASNKVSCEMSDYGGDDRTTQVSAKPTRHRVRSLDTFRGISIAIMIFVNDGAGHYWFLEHVTWDGLLLADCVFPWFMWIMGVCIPISVRSQLKRGVSRWKILGNILKRAIILFGLGLMLNTAGAGPDLERIRIPGVLQRFSVVYLIVATLAVCFTSRASSSDNRFPGPKIAEVLQDVTFLLPQWIVILSVIAAYCYFVFWAPVPGCPSGYLGPGGIQDGKRFLNCIGGMTGYVDKVVLGENHVYQYPTANEVYKSGAFDPEGLLGVLPSILQVFLGVQAGSILLHHATWKARLIRWGIWGIICAIVALILALPGIIPINKNLWSLSFVFTTSGAAFFLLSFIYFLQDHLRIWNGVPFKAPGMNPTILYVGHSIAYELFPFHWRYGHMNTHFVLTIEALWGTSLWIIIAYWLYYIEFFLSI